MKDNELPKINLSEEEQEHVRKCIKEMENQLFDALRASYCDMPAAELVAKPLSKEDLDRFREEWEKIMNDPKSFGTIRTEPAKLYPINIHEIVKPMKELMGCPIEVDDTLKDGQWYLKEKIGRSVLEPMPLIKWNPDITK